MLYFNGRESMFFRGGRPPRCRLPVESPNTASERLVPYTLNASAGARFRSCIVSTFISVFVGLTLTCTSVAAQTAMRVSAAEENVRAQPNGERVAVLNRDFRLVAGESRGQWRAVTLDAWVPARSVIVNRRDGFNVVLAGGGAALHAGPGGAPAGRAMGGVPFNEITRQGAWVRVQRPAWVWSPSLAAAPATSRAAATAPHGRQPPAASTTPAAARPPAPGPGAAAGAAAGAGAPQAAEAAPAGPPRATGRALHAAPGGDTIASVSPAARFEVIGREGEWARVRVEGWVRAGAGGEVQQPDVLRDLSLRALRSEPERYRGMSVQWQIQFMALQRADSIRTDFQRGEPYILARDPGGEPGFVYIAVSADQLAEVRRLSPLQRLEVVARVRNGRSPLTGHPVLELVEIRR